MGRIRSVKPELPQQPWFATLTDAAARTYYGLLSVVDDCGRCPADPLFIGGQIFWGRQRPAAAITRQLTELERAGIIRRYRARGGEYLEIVGWSSKGGPLYQQDECRMWTYAIAAPANGAIKIGRSADVERRLAELQTAHPGDLVLHGAIYGDIEQAIHAQLDTCGKRLRGEWFAFDGETIEILAAHGIGRADR